MKRDMELVREILDFIETPVGVDLTHGVGDEDLEKRFPNVSRRDLLGHLDILRDAGLIDGVHHDASTIGGRDALWVDIRLTWAGHDFLGPARVATIWEGARKQAGSMFASLPLEVIKALLVEGAKRAVGL